MTINQHYKNKNSQGVVLRDNRERLLSGGQGGLSQQHVGQGSVDSRVNPNKFAQYMPPGTDKQKKVVRKLNSGVPAKVLIGRQGQNVVPGQANFMDHQSFDMQNRKTMNNFKVQAQMDRKVRMSQDEQITGGKSLSNL